MSHSSEIYNNITELIGNSPIIHLKNTPDDAADVYVKLEAFNPGGSIKDRVALAMIKKAEAKGQLKAAGTIIEATSGNTGIGLAWIGAALGYNVKIVMPDSFSIERRKLIQAYGAELILTPASEGFGAAVALAEELATENNWFLPNQFENLTNQEIHELTTGPEIIDAFGPTGLDAFVAAAGTGGTLSGVSHALKKANPKLKVYVVESAGSPILSGGEVGSHLMQGLLTASVPHLLDLDAYDQVIDVQDSDAIELGRLIGSKEGFLVGISSAAAIWAAIEVAKELGKGKKVLAIAPDNGERYLSTELFEFE